MFRRRGAGFIPMVLLVTSGAYAQCVTNVPAGAVVGVWTEAGSPYCIQGDVQVASVEIQPGVQVVFLGNFSFAVEGVLKAVGSVDHWISFGPDDNVAGWRGVVFDTSGEGSELAYVSISGATDSGITIKDVPSPPIIRDCNISDNSVVANRGGGIRVINSGPVTIDRCTIARNTAYNSRGGSNGYGGGIFADGSLNINDSVIIDNKVQSSGSTGGTKWAGGGGVFAEHLYLQRTRVERNTAHYVGNNSYLNSEGGGIAVRGDATVENSVLNGNIASCKNYAGLPGWGSCSTRGGGVINWENVEIVNSTIHGNHAGQGGGIYTSGATATTTILNSILWDNVSEIDGDGTNTVEFSIVQGGFPGYGNIAVNPVFSDADRDPGLHISYGSPAIDSGDCTSSSADDIDGEGRPFGGGCDIGADELTVHFADVQSNHWAAAFVEALFRSGITVGCTSDNFCPATAVKRAEMAAFLVRAIEGEPAPNYCGGVTPFLDFWPEHWACGYIKRLKELGLTTGCGGGDYCPEEPVKRDQMAAFLVRAIDGDAPAGYCSDTAPFADVPADYWACGNIKRLAELEITTGCGGGNYCPNDDVTRDQMAAFLTRAFLWK